MRKERTCQVVSFQLWGSGELERLVIHSLQSNSHMDKILNTGLGAPQPQLMPCIFNRETRVSTQQSGAQSAAAVQSSQQAEGTLRHRQAAELLLLLPLLVPGVISSASLISF